MVVLIIDLFLLDDLRVLHSADYIRVVVLVVSLLNLNLSFISKGSGAWIREQLL